MAYKDFRGYERNGKEHTDLVHRNRAYHIYLENRWKYPLPFSAYEVHHKDFDKTNNKVSNLQIVTPTEHDRLHEEKKKQEQKEKEEYQKKKAKWYEEQKRRGKGYGEKEWTARLDELKRFEREAEERENRNMVREEAFKIIEQQNRRKERIDKIKNGVSKGIKGIKSFFAKKEKPLYCIDCNRSLNHIGRCLACNMKAKKKIEAQKKKRH